MIQKGGRTLNKIAVIGGDRREKVLIETLADQDFEINVLSNTPFNSVASKDNVFFSTDIKQIIKKVDTVIAPMSSTDSNGFLKSTFIETKLKLDENFFKLFSKNMLFIIGIAQPNLKSLLEKEDINYIELARLDDIAIMNAIPTAEGAIKIAIEETDITIYNSSLLITGLGKVGMTLAWRLKLLGANVYGVTRNKAAIARGRDLGIEMVSYNNLDEYLPEIDILFNTVPAKIIGKEYISLLKNETLIIDLASDPGGTDFEAAKSRGIKAILALGLPGKIAPLTAGKILADTIPEIIKEHFSF